MKTQEVELFRQGTNEDQSLGGNVLLQLPLKQPDDRTLIIQNFRLS